MANTGVSLHDSFEMWATMTKAEAVIQSLIQPLCVCGHEKEEHIDARIPTGLGKDYEVVDWWCNGCLGGPELCQGNYTPPVLQ